MRFTTDNKEKILNIKLINQVQTTIPRKCLFLLSYLLSPGLNSLLNSFLKINKSKEFCIDSQTNPKLQQSQTAVLFHDTKNTHFKKRFTWAPDTSTFFINKSQGAAYHQRNTNSCFAENMQTAAYSASTNNGNQGRGWQSS